MSLFMLSLLGPRPFDDLFDDPPYGGPPKPEPKDEGEKPEKEPEKG